MRKRKITTLIIATIMTISGCASTIDWAKSNSGKTTLLALGRIASVALSVYVPEAGVILNSICTAAETKTKDAMVEGLQKAWVAADEAQVTAVVESINTIVATTKILDEPTTEKKLNDTQAVLKEMCCATGKCN